MEKQHGDVGGAAAPPPGTGITNGGGAATTNEVKPSENGPVSKSFSGLSTDRPDPPVTNGNHTKGGGDKEEGSGTTNGHSTGGSAAAASAAENGDEADADADGTELMRVDEEGADEEEALFAELEKQEEEEEGKAFEQPRDYHAAPKLLQKDLETGAVKADDSEEESDREHGGTALADGSLKTAAAAVAVAEESKPAVVSSHHIHGRVRFDIGCSRMNRAWMCRRL